MKITSFNRADIAKLYKPQQVDSKSESSSLKKHVETDSLEISNRARDLQKFKAEMKKVPEVRKELVLDLKHKIEQGTYAPSAKKIAAAIMEESKVDLLV
ncbi:flagellar biosynthesis anti-sigma factor FlgM [Peptococcaceae bacterium]|nr:flagellar biosynthesis anti-sigma factor FlgM [Peptococcaceae bacterium]